MEENQTPMQKEYQITHSVCLSDDEIATYEIEEKEEGGGKAKIFIENKNNKKIFSFQIDISNSNHYHPIELYKCGVYTIRTFDYDYQKKIPLENYRRELWRYNYNGKGETLITSYAKWSFEEILGDFRIDPTEFYVFLIRSCLGQPDYAIVIKDLKTKEDVFVLTLDEILEQYSDVQAGSFGLGIFTPDNKYYWGDIYIGAYETAYYRIEMGTWKIDILSMPPGLPSGAERAWNFAGWLAYADIASFTGMKEFTEQIEEEAKREGKMKNLWVYNLFTEEKIKIASVDPERRFSPQWLSDTELEYEMPDGEKRIYSTNNQ